MEPDDTQVNEPNPPHPFEGYDEWLDSVANDWDAIVALSGVPF